MQDQFLRIAIGAGQRFVDGSDCKTARHPAVINACDDASIIQIDDRAVVSDNPVLKIHVREIRTPDPVRLFRCEVLVKKI